MLARDLSKQAAVVRQNKTVESKKKIITGTYTELDEDKFLINRIKTSRDGDAFGKIVEKYRDKIRRLARGITRSDADADDVVQDVFLTVLQKIDTFEGRSSFSSWLYRVSINAAYMKVRSRKSTQAYDQADIEIMESEHEKQNNYFIESDPEVSAANKKNIEFIHEAIEKLPEKYRSVILLRDIEELSTQEVADRLKLKTPAVKSRLHRARLFLRKRLIRLYELNVKGDDETEPNYSFMISNLKMKAAEFEAR